MEYLPVPTADQLRALQAALPSCQEVRHIEQFKGGLGCTNDLLELEETTGQLRLAVLRRYGQSRSAGTARVAARERSALALAARGGSPVPTVLWWDKTHRLAGSATLTSYVDGEPDAAPKNELYWAGELASAAAGIHSVVPNALERRALLDSMATCHALAEQAEPGSRFQRHDLGIQLWERRRMLAAQLGGGTDAVLLHGDYHPGNVLWRHGELRAVIDWEDAGFGDPIADVAYCAADMHYMGMSAAADHFVERYADTTGRSMASLAAWTVVAVCRPLPDIARWLPSWQVTGRPDMTADELRSRHRTLAKEALATTA
jgi:aminoglycoside phosphotransferase (APT) family kinase protein